MLIYSHSILVTVTSECCVKMMICKIWTGHSAWTLTKCRPRSDARRRVCHGLFILPLGDNGRICSVFEAFLSRVRPKRTQKKKKKKKKKKIKDMLYANFKDHDKRSSLTGSDHSLICAIFDT